MLHSENTAKTSCFSHFIAISFIPFLFLVGLILGYVGIVSLKVELHTLLMVAFIFVVFMFFVKHNANYVICHIRDSFESMEADMLTALRENTLTIMESSKSTLYIKDFITEYYRGIRNDNFVRVAPSVFPMMGILGTFIAIALSMPDFTVKDLSALDREISLLLSGIGTAFYASIYGIMLSLIWIYFEKSGSTKVDRIIYDLERTYSNRVWRESELVKHRHMQSELKDKEVVQTLKETFNMDFIKELNEQYLRNYRTIINDTSNSFEQLTARLQDASTDLRSTLDKVQDRTESVNAVSTIRENIKGFNSNARNLQHSMERFDATVDHTFDKIDSEVGEIVEKLSTFAHIISEQNQMILRKMEEVQESEKQIDV